eukprot:TRINITY_DN6627_c0_g1_i7.p2 TRINITY_DN6627_c0_g1~~TRINITY_DN6627_c0_g1_i7.p2  ORF type:complete len:559 (+),score=79.66 TRINITY_DN6627_c0_g1_i7:63-1739(+)
MGSWAQIAGQPKPVVEQVDSEWFNKANTICVVDANAIITGTRVDRLGDVVVSIPEVLSEVRDKKSREFLDQLPFGIRTMHPEAPYINRIRTFARETGDLQVLSEVDVKLLALSVQLDIKKCGSDDHLRKTPLPARSRGRKKGHRKLGGSKLPGWDYIKNPEDWSELDKEEEDENEGDNFAQHASRIKKGVFKAEQQSTTQDDSIRTDEFSFGFDADEVQYYGYEEEAEIEVDFEIVDDQVHLIISEIVFEEAEGSVDDLDFWDVEQSQEESDECDDKLPQILEYPDIQQPDVVTTNVINQTQKDLNSQNEQDNNEEWQIAYKSRNAQRRRQRKQYKREQRQKQVQDETQQSTEVESVTDAEIQSNFESQEKMTRAVQCVTSDFAMQNVLLQLGLQLRSPDGRRITEVRQWALRCRGCQFVVRESGRIFCPTCGKATLDKVEVTVGSNGAECVGMRKFYCLKGTRFPLPKPKSGRYAKNPILSEDELMMQVKKLKNSSRFGQGKISWMDPFAPEYGPDTWHQTTLVREGSDQLNTYALNANWRRNPNARKMMPRSNRRK